MRRIRDIQQKLAYALTRAIELREEVNKALPAGKQPPFLGDKVGSILAACRECFDYAARDVAESYLSDRPRTVYFPLAMEQRRTETYEAVSQAPTDLHAHRTRRPGSWNSRWSPDPR